MSKSKKAVFLKDWTDEVGRNMEQFHEASALMVRKHQKSQHKTHTFAATLKDMAQHEQCLSIKESLDTLSTALANAEQARTQLLAHVQHHVVNQFPKYPPKLKIQQMNIAARNRAYQQFVSAQKKFVSTKANAAVSKQQHAKEMFDAERKRLQAAEHTLNTAICEFEQQRVAEIQSMLKKYINAEIHWLSESMTGLSMALQKVVMIDSVREAEKWMEEMHRLEAVEQAEDHAATQQIQQQLLQQQPSQLQLQPQVLQPQEESKEQMIQQQGAQAYPPYSSPQQQLGYANNVQNPYNNPSPINNNNYASSPTQQQQQQQPWNTSNTQTYGNTNTANYPYGTTAPVSNNNYGAPAFNRMASQPLPTSAISNTNSTAPNAFINPNNNINNAPPSSSYYNNNNFNSSTGSLNPLTSSNVSLLPSGGFNNTSTSTLNNSTLFTNTANKPPLNAMLSSPGGFASI